MRNKTHVESACHNTIAALSASAERFTSCERASHSEARSGCCNSVRVMSNNPCCPRLLIGVYDILFFQESTAKRCKRSLTNYRRFRILLAYTRGAVRRGKIQGSFHAIQTGKTNTFTFHHFTNQRRVFPQWTGNVTLPALALPRCVQRRSTSLPSLAKFGQGRPVPAVRKRRARQV